MVFRSFVKNETEHNAKEGSMNGTRRGSPKTWLKSAGKDLKRMDTAHRWEVLAEKKMNGGRL